MRFFTHCFLVHSIWWFLLIKYSVKLWVVVSKSCLSVNIDKSYKGNSHELNTTGLIKMHSDRCDIFNDNIPIVNNWLEHKCYDQQCKLGHWLTDLSNLFKNYIKMNSTTVGIKFKKFLCLKCLWWVVNIQHIWRWRKLPEKEVYQTSKIYLFQKYLNLFIFKELNFSSRQEKPVN